MGNTVEQTAGVGVFGVGEKVRNATLFSDPASIHDGDSFTYLSDHPQIVSDKNDSHAAFFLQALNQ